MPTRFETTTNPTAHLRPTSHQPASPNLLVKLMQECHSLQINEKTSCRKTRWPTYFWAAQQIVHWQETNPTPTALLISEQNKHVKKDLQQKDTKSCKLSATFSRPYTCKTINYSK